MIKVNIAHLANRYQYDDQANRTECWNDVPHGTLDVVSLFVRLRLPFCDGRLPHRLFLVGRTA
jgi:hypothetical protein